MGPAGLSGYRSVLVGCSREATIPTQSASPDARSWPHEPASQRSLEVDAVLRIKVVEGKDKGKKFELDQGIVTVGRSPYCSVALNDELVSHIHGQFGFRGSSCFFRDLLSSNGSVLRRDRAEYLLGPLRAEFEVEKGDEIVLGDTILRLQELPCAAPNMDETIVEEPFDRTHVETASGATGDDEPPASEAFERVQPFFELPPHDPCSEPSTKAAVCDALQKAFPQAACISLIDLKPGYLRTDIRDFVDQDDVVFAPRTGEQAGKYSYRVLEEAFEKQGPVMYGAQSELPETESVQEAAMKSCVCVPLRRDEAITGFIQMHTADYGERFTRRDLHVFRFLCQLASLLINRASAAEKWLEAAAAGLVVRGLGHDAKPILETIGLNIKSVEKDVQGLAQNESWSYVKGDVKFVGWIAKDAAKRIYSARRDLDGQCTPLRPIVDDALDKCSRYFLDGSLSWKVGMINACDEQACAFVHKDGLRQALMNGVKNAVRAQKRKVEVDKNRNGKITITSGDDPTARDRFVLLSICDDAAGISDNVLSQLGKAFAAGDDQKGSGLGVYLMCDLVNRMRGEVEIATAEQPEDDVPAGTVVTFRLPKDGTAPKPDPSHRIKIIPGYAEHRKSVEQPTAEGE